MPEISDHIPLRLMAIGFRRSGQPSMLTIAVQNFASDKSVCDLNCASCDVDMICHPEDKTNNRKD
jgi:hypothetical protein